MVSVYFNAKFFLTTTILSLFAGMSYHSYSWLLDLHVIRLGQYTPWLWLVIEPTKLLFGVFMPFAVVYVLTTRENPKTAKPLLITTFLGCWVGQLATIAIDRYITYFEIDDLLHFTLATTWQIFASLFSLTLFVSLTAILLAHHQKTTTNPTSSTHHTY